MFECGWKSRQNEFSVHHFSISLEITKKEKRDLQIFSVFICIRDINFQSSRSEPKAEKEEISILCAFRALPTHTRCHELKTATR